MRKKESFYTSFKECKTEYDFYKFEVYEDGRDYIQLVNYIDEKELEYEICRYDNDYATIIIRVPVSCNIRIEMMTYFSGITDFEFEGNVTLKQSNLYRIFKRLESF